MKTCVLESLILRSSLVAILLGSALGGPASAGDSLVVHEWGTFTALQDDDGTALAGINVDDEPLPAFVHNLGRDLLKSPTGLRDDEAIVMKGAPQRHPYVTLRLETPVLYFYPPADRSGPVKLDVHVDFHSGWLTEFYPQAVVDAPGLKQGSFRFGEITPQTTGSLDWHDVQVGTEAPGPKTDSYVWTTPRAVHAAGLTAASGESEQYLFYRGVGNLDAPLHVTSHRVENTIELGANFVDVLPDAQPVAVGPLWLVHVRHDGQAAFRTLAPIEATGDRKKVLAAASRDFATTDFSPDALDTLSQSMHAALVSAGLYDDEATAMLTTWRRAYFTSPGLRLFFIVPRGWTDAVLPLRISQPCEIQRVMMARIELVSPEQRALLEALRDMTLSDLSWLNQARRSPNFDRLVAGRADFGDLGVAIPADFQAYLDMGRFRSALLMAELQKRPSKNLAAFASAYGLRPYRQTPQPGRR